MSAAYRAMTRDVNAIVHYLRTLPPLGNQARDNIAAPSSAYAEADRIVSGEFRDEAPVC